EYRFLMFSWPIDGNRRIELSKTFTLYRSEARSKPKCIFSCKRLGLHRKSNSIGVTLAPATTVLRAIVVIRPWAFAASAYNSAYVGQAANALLSCRLHDLGRPGAALGLLST